MERITHEIFALLRRLNESKGIAPLVVTHDPRLAQRCDRIIAVVDGRVLPEKPRPVP